MAVGTDFKVTIYESDLDHIAAWVLEYPNIETGGNLFGFWTHSGAPAIQVVLGPGRHARHQGAAFFQDVDYLRDCGGQLQRDHGLQHIGDWHSHHRFGLDHPSSGDAATVHHTLESNGFPRFLACIANIRDADDIQPGEAVYSADRHDDYGNRSGRRGGEVVCIQAYLFEPGRSEPRRGRWSVLPGQSPISMSANRARVTARVPQRGGRWRVPAATNTRAQAAPPSAWYSTGWGRDFLIRLDELGRQVYSSTAITVNSDSGELSYRCTADHGLYVVAFPAAFPTRHAELIRPDGVREPVHADRQDRAHDFFERLRYLTDDAGTAHRSEEDPGDQGVNAPTTSIGEEGTDVLDSDSAATAGAGESDSRTLLPDAGVVPTD